MSVSSFGTSKIASKVVGIDVSLRSTGIVVYSVDDNAIVESYRIILPKSESIDFGYYDYAFYRDFVGQNFKNTLEEVSKDIYNTLFVIEGVTPHGKVKTSLKIQLARIVYFEYIREYGMGKERVCTPSVQKWKHDFTGRLNSTKEETLELLRNSFSHVKGLTYAISNVDTMDATALALWGAFYGKNCKTERTKPSKSTRKNSKQRRKRTSR